MLRPNTKFADLLVELALSVGMSRPAGLCLAATWRAAQAPCADDLVATLGLSRSNVSTALKELRGWGLVGTARAPGDRKEYFTAPADPWEILRLILAGRQRRVIGPLLDRLIAAEADSGDVRLAALHEALSQVGAAMEALVGLEPAELARRLGGLAQAEDKPKKKKKKR